MRAIPVVATRLRCLAFVSVLVAATSPSAAQDACKRQLQDELPRYLKLSVEVFDQDPEQGWRRLAAGRCWRETAEAIGTYVANLPAPPYVHFHGAQAAAKAGDYALARRFLDRSERRDMDPDAPFKWNAYVRAVRAFIDGDLGALLQQRSIVALREDVSGNAINLKVIDKLIAGFGRPYAAAFD